jgi:hypothetical protein
MPPKLAVSGHDSAGERVQKLVPAAHVVKAFNTVGHAHMFRPTFPGGPPGMFVCGNDEGAKRVGAVRSAEPKLESRVQVAEEMTTTRAASGESSRRRTR